jgi:hypothetical protein
MNIKIFLLVIIALAMLAPACSRKSTQTSEGVEEIVMDDLSAEEREKLLKSSGINLKENKYLSDNLSRVEISYDNFGIRVERQYYNNLPNIKYIAVHTFPNGSKQVFIYGANGSVRSLSENMMNEIAKASPDQLTGDAPVYAENQQNQPNTGGMSIKTLPPITSQPTPVQAAATPIQIQPTPIVETAEKPAETKPQTESKPQEQPVVKETPNTVSPKDLKRTVQIPTKN